jgi:RNA polymerase sigma-70 factor (ECF subfamily)
MSADTSFENLAATTLHTVADTLNGDNEATLVAQARNGSSTAIEQLVGRYERRIFRLAQNITSNHEDAEECVQNAFAKAFQNLAAFRGDSRFYTWLVRIAVNEALMKIRRRRFTELSIDAGLNETEGDDHMLFHELRDWGPNPEERYSQEELGRILTTAISGLDPRYRVVFQLRDVEGFSTEETARVLDLSVAAVKTRLLRARFWLRNSLDVYFREAKSSGGRSRRPGILGGSGRCATLPKPTVGRLTAISHL